MRQRDIPDLCFAEECVVILLSLGQMFLGFPFHVVQLILIMLCSFALLAVFPSNAVGAVSSPVSIQNDAWILHGN